MKELSADDTAAGKRSGVCSSSSSSSSSSGAMVRAPSAGRYGRGSCGAASPFNVLERLLPASLWPPSLVSDRAAYTLNPVATESAAKSETMTTSPSASASSSSSGTPMGRYSGDSGASAASHWSLMGMQRAFMQARYPHGVGFSPAATATAAADGGEKNTRSCSDSGDVAGVSLPRRPCKRPRSHSGGGAARGQGAGAVGSGPDSSLVAVGGKGAVLGVLEELLDQVEARHRTLCPLCSPASPPNWFSTGGRGRPPKNGPPPMPRQTPKSTSLSPPASHSSSASSASSSMSAAAAAPSTRSSSSEGARREGDRGPVAEAHHDDDDDEEEERRALLLRRAEGFLAFHRGRVSHLLDSHPAMYQKDPTVEHDLVRRCRETGGIALLEALLIGM